MALLKPLLDSETPHTLEAIKVAERFYHGKYPKMRLRDWAALVKTITYKDKFSLTEKITFRPAVFQPFRLTF